MLATNRSSLGEKVAGWTQVLVIFVARRDWSVQMGGESRE
jgi:hypothetical protein